MKKIVVFDFDGTLTTADTLIALLRFARGTGYLIFALLLFSPMSSAAGSSTSGASRCGVSPRGRCCARHCSTATTWWW